MPPESPEPGPWRTSRIPYFIEIMRRCSDPTVELVSIVCGAQMGKTEAMMCIAGHRLDDGPYVPVLWIAPTAKSVKSLSDDRFIKMLRSTPSLWNKLAKGRRNKIAEKWIGGVRVGFGWAGSATELASHPAGIVLVDERDRMVGDVEGEGDPLILASARTKNYALKKIIVSSTPTMEGASPIWALHLESSMEWWTWPCPHCRESFAPRLEYLKWPEGATPAHARQTAWVECPQCGGRLTDRHKPGCNRNGRYISHHIDDEGVIHQLVETTPNTHSGFWISGLCSPWQTFGEIAQQLLAAYKSKDQERIQAVVNTYAGEIYRVQGEAPPWERVLDCRRPYHPGGDWGDVQLITMGVDVQKDSLYYVIRGWGWNAQSCLLAHGQLHGRTDYDNVWIALANLISAPISGRFVQRVFIDSGYRPGTIWRRPENMIYLFCQRHRGLAYPTKGHDRQDRPLKTSDLEISAQGRRVQRALRIWHVDTDALKTWLYARIEWPEDEPGSWTVYQDIDEDYARQICSEEVVVKANGFRMWIARGANHYLDCEVLTYAAALSLNVHHLTDPGQATPPPTGPIVLDGFERRNL